MKRTCRLCSKKFVADTSNPSQRYCLDCSPWLSGLRRKVSGRDYPRTLVRIRDKFTCQDCGFVKREVMPGAKSLDVHHLNGQCGKKTKSYDRVADIGGLITLCHKCHYGRHDFSKKRTLGRTLKVKGLPVKKKYTGSIPAVPA